MPLFETFGDDQIAELAGLMQKREFGEGEALITQGDEGREMFILDAVRMSGSNFRACPR